MSPVEEVARSLSIDLAALGRELRRAIRRSEPDARDVYSVVAGRRVVFRLEGGEWRASLEARPQPWERRIHR